MVSRFSYLGNLSLGYRYSFNGKENDADVKGDGNQIDYGMRAYDPRLGKFLSGDPLAQKYPYYTPYQFAGNNPIQAKDLDGLEPAAAPVSVAEPAIDVARDEHTSVGPVKTMTTAMSANSMGKSTISPGSAIITPGSTSRMPDYYHGPYLQGGSGSFVDNGYGVQRYIPSAREVFEMNLQAEKEDDEKQKSLYRGPYAIISKKLFQYGFTDHATPVNLPNVNSSYERITTDARNLKGNEILEIKKRIENGNATAMDKLYIAQLVKERSDYMLNPKHDKTKPLGDANASVAPSNHAELWDNRVIYDIANDTYWSIEGKGNKAVFHRFKGDNNGTYHWNGSTGQNSNRGGRPVRNSFSTNEVPPEVKKLAGYKKG